MSFRHNQESAAQTGRTHGGAKGAPSRGTRLGTLQHRSTGRPGQTGQRRGWAGSVQLTRGAGESGLLPRAKGSH